MLTHIYRYRLTMFKNFLIWQLYRLNNGKFELVWEFIGIRYLNWNTINWDSFRR